MKELVLVWDDPKIRIDMMRVLYPMNRPHPHNTQYVMFVQDAYRNKQPNELLVFCTTISKHGGERLLALKLQEPELKYVAVSIENVPQETYHEWSTAVLTFAPDLKFFDPNVGGPVFNRVMSETGYA
jgi:hypothetical protein